MLTVVGVSGPVSCLSFLLSQTSVWVWALFVLDKVPSDPRLASNLISDWERPWTSDSPQRRDNRCLSPHPVFSIHVDCMEHVCFSVCAKYAHTLFPANVSNPLSVRVSPWFCKNSGEGGKGLKSSRTLTRWHFAWLHGSSLWVLCAGLLYSSGIMGRVPRACAKVWKLNRKRENFELQNAELNKCKTEINQPQDKRLGKIITQASLILCGTRDTSITFGKQIVS